MTGRDESMWVCEACTLKNPARRRRCQACENRRPVLVEALSPSTTTVTSTCIIDGGTASSGSTPVASPRRASSAAATNPALESSSAAASSGLPEGSAPSLVSDWLRRQRKRKRPGEVTLRVVHNDDGDSFFLDDTLEQQQEPLVEEIRRRTAANPQRAYPLTETPENDPCGIAPSARPSSSPSELERARDGRAPTDAASSNSPSLPSSTSEKNGEEAFLGADAAAPRDGAASPAPQLDKALPVAHSRTGNSNLQQTHAAVLDNVDGNNIVEEDESTGRRRYEICHPCEPDAGVGVDPTGRTESEHHPQSDVAMGSVHCRVVALEPNEMLVDDVEIARGSHCDGTVPTMEEGSSCNSTVVLVPRSTPTRIAATIPSSIPGDSTVVADPSPTEQVGKSQTAANGAREFDVSSAPDTFPATLQRQSHSPSLDRLPSPVMQPEVAALGGADDCCFVYTQSSQEMGSSQDVLSQEQVSPRLPYEHTPLPDSSRRAQPTSPLSTEHQEGTCNTSQDLCHKSQNQCEESLVSPPPSAKFTGLVVPSPVERCTSTDSEWHAPIFATAGRGRPIHVSGSELDRANQLWESLAATPGVPLSESAIRRAGQVGQETTVLPELSMDAMKSTPAACQFSSHHEPKVSNGLNDKSNLLATAFQTAGSGEYVSIPQSSMTCTAFLFLDETNLEPPYVAAMKPCTSEETAAKALASSRPSGSSAVAGDAPLVAPASSARPSVEHDESRAVAGTVKLAFATALHGRELAVTADGVARANALWEDHAGNAKVEKRPRVSFLGDDKWPPAAPTSGPKSIAHSTAPTFQGFTTAGRGHTVTVTSETLSRAGAWLDDHVETPALPKCHTRTSVMNSTKRDGLRLNRDCLGGTTQATQASSTSVTPFATAGQRRVVSVSTESIPRASALLENRDIAFQTPALPRHTHLASSLNSSTGLSCDGSTELPKSIIPPNDPYCLPSFTTAGSRRVVSASAESVAKANALLADKAVDFQTPAPLQRAPRVSFTDSKLSVSLQSAERHRDLDSIRSHTDNFSDTCEEATGISACHGQINSVSHSVRTQGSACLREQFGTFDTPVAPFRATRVSFVDSGVAAPSPVSSESHVDHKDLLSVCSLKDDDLPKFATAGQRRVLSVSLESTERAQALLERHFGDADTGESLCEDETETVQSMLAASEKPSESGIQPSEQHQVTSRGGNFVGFVERASVTRRSDFRGPGPLFECESLVWRVNSINAPAVRFDPSSKRPCDFASHSSASCSLIGELSDYRTALRKLGVDTRLIKDKWILNHIRWIVWKLASLERTFPRSVLVSSLTFDAVVKRLKARHNREFLKGERSPLRKVLNRDVSSISMMILCVARIVFSSEGSRETVKVELTDGWYSVGALIDVPLSSFVSKGIIKVGSKLLVSNSNLLGCEEGVDPLDASYDAMNEDSSPRLCISANSTRLARWDSKLGFVRPTKAVTDAGGLLQVVKISDALESGGRIPMIELVVVRKYPLLYRVSSASDTPSLAADPVQRFKVYTEIENEDRVRCFEKKKEKFVEGIVDEVEAECMKEVDQDAPELWNRFLRHQDPEGFIADLDSRDRQELETWRERRSVLLQARRQQEIEARLEELESENEQVVPFIRILVQSPRESKPRSKDEKLTEEAMLTVWNPTEEQLEAMREGNAIRIKNAGVGNKRYDGMLQLTANGRTSISVATNAATSTRTRICDVARLNLLSHQVLGKSRSTYCSRVSDLMAIVLSVSRSQDPPSWSVMLTDSSGLLSRVQGRSDTGITPMQLLEVSSPNVASSLYVALFRHIRILPFDSSVGCGVAEFLDTSTVSRPACCGRAQALLQWAASDRGISRISGLLSRLNARIPGQRSPVVVAFGFIIELCLVSTQQLHIKVDCSGGAIHTWKFPLSLMPKFLSIAEDTSDYVALNSEDEKKLASLMNVGLAFRSRRDLYRFQLQPFSAPSTDDFCMYKVVDISSTDTDSLTSYFLWNA